MLERESISMENLPHDIQSKILSYVPCESVLECKLVSKTWKNLLSHIKGGLLVYIGERKDRDSSNTDITFRLGFYDEILTRDHGNLVTDATLREANIAYRSLVGSSSYLIGSCNGLVCLSIPDFLNRVSINDYVFNPLTGECFNLPKIILHKQEEGLVGTRIASGFGYDRCSRKYKVVRIQFTTTGAIGSVCVYSLGGGDHCSGWRHIGEINYKFYYDGILWNGSIHWLAWDDDDSKWKIVAFDLADEKFGYLQTTPPCTNKDLFLTRLKLLGGYLSVVVSVDQGSIMSTNIWSLKNEKDDDNYEGYQSWTWSLEFSIQTVPHTDWISYRVCEPFAITKNNQVLFWYKYPGISNDPPVVCCYDPKIDTITAVNKIFDWDAYDMKEFDGIPHVNSLVSFKSLGIDPVTTTAIFAAERM